MVQTENLSGRIPDEKKADYLKLISDARVRKANEDFSRGKRLDEDFELLLRVTGFEVSKDLKKLVRQILFLMLGQAADERGFDVNEEILITSLQQKSLIAQRIVHDAICASGKPLNEFVIQFVNASY